MLQHKYNEIILLLTKSVVVTIIKWNISNNYSAQMVLVMEILVKDKDI